MQMCRRLSVYLVLAFGGIWTSFGELRAQSYTDSGYVYQINTTQGISGVTVAACCKNASGFEIQLAQTTTDSVGSFSITFNTSNCASTSAITLKFTKLGWTKANQSEPNNMSVS